MITPSGIEIVHADHGLENEHFAFIDFFIESTVWEMKGAGFVDIEHPSSCLWIEVLTLPEEISSLPSTLYGPEVGDDPITEDMVTYTIRNGRLGPSRLVDLPIREARKVCVVMMSGKILTAYGTQMNVSTPREWWDPGMRPLETLEAATFWAIHASSLHYKR